MKKKKTKLLSVLLTAILLVGMFPLSIFASEVDVISTDETIKEEQITPEVVAPQIQSEESPTILAAAALTKPGAIQNLTAIENATSITLNWQAPTTGDKADGYRLRSRNNSDYRPSWSGWIYIGDGTTYTANQLNANDNYSFEIFAYNWAGDGPTSQISAVPGIAPSAPRNLEATASDKKVALNWRQPTTGDVTKYQVSLDGVNWLDTTSRSYTFSNLDNGKSYTFSVRAVSYSKLGTIATIAETPSTLPSKIQNLSVQEKDKSVTLNWNAPADNGGSNITDYQVRSRRTSEQSWSAWVSTNNTTTYTFSNLTNKTKYSFEVRAVNKNGNSQETSIQGTPAYIPGIPKNLKAVAGDRQVALTWGAPASEDPITKYQVSLNNITWTDVNTTHYEYTNLVNGNSYTFYVRALTSLRTGAAAIKFASPATTPERPQNITALPSDHQVALTWEAPSNDGGSAVTSYQVSRDGTSWVKVNDTQYTFTELTNGTEYTFFVYAVNQMGNGKQANIKETPATTPTQPQNITALPSDQQMALTWEAPSDNGGYAVTTYQVSSDGSTWIDVNNTQYTFTELTNGTEYTFSVRAVNQMGAGTIADINETPATTPTQPQNITALPSDQQVALTWDAPSDNGGQAITTYQVSSNGSTWLDVNDTQYTFTELTNGTEYTFSIRAVNQMGAGTIADIKETPATTPEQPENLAAVAGDRQVALTWAAPLNDGGRTVTSYEVSFDGNTWVTVNNTQYTFTELTNGTVYTFYVRAVNQMGPGAIASTIGLPATTPTQPQNLAAVPSDRQVALTWEAPLNDGGRAVTSYQVSSDGSTWVNVDNTQYTFTELTNGTEYTFSVRAVNQKGFGTLTNIKETPATSPTQPENLAAVPSDKQVALTWEAPLNDGGRAVTSYEVSSDGSTWVNVDNTQYTFTELTNGTEYTFSVRAINQMGTGTIADIKETPATTPEQPENLTAVPSDRQVALTWAAPLNDGGRTVTSYEVSFDGNTWVTVNNTQYTFTELTNGTIYTFYVR